MFSGEMMLHFDSDYMEGAHPLIFQKLLETNMEQTAGYGNDNYCTQAKEKIRRACACMDAEIHFMVGGTQVNATVIKSLLRTYEGVLAAHTGHISTHEAGAIELGGHKVIELTQEYGKITASQVEGYLQAYYKDTNHLHCVKPGMVYISHPTEYGTLYSKAELESLSYVCRKYKIPLYLDGARLGYGLVAKSADVTLETIATYCDVFYIGGTKVGALFGEAVVFPRPGLVENFFTIIKQHGGLLAKGRLLGIQFDVLFSDNLYCSIAQHAIRMAEKIKDAFLQKEYSFYFDSPTNQQFVILTDKQIKNLSKSISFGFWEALDGERSVVRFATSWATQEQDVEKLIQLL